MPLTTRPFATEADKALMVALARHAAATTFHLVDLPYRLSSWAFVQPENTRLWFDADQQLRAWAVLQTPFWNIDYVCHPDVEATLHAEILAWADARAQAIVDTPHGHPAWFINVFPSQTTRLQELAQAGFHSQADVGENSWSKVLMRRAAALPVPGVPLPEGFSVRPLAGEKEVEAYVEIHQAAFESKNMNAAWRRRTLQHPAYKPELDLVVEAPEGRLAAFCVCWFDEPTRTGQVEPLGRHPDFRHTGVGRVALAAGLHRLQALGAQAILVETDNYRNTAFRLYETFGFQVVQDILVYRKDYAAGSG